MFREGEVLRLNGWAELAGWIFAVAAGLAAFLLLSGPAPGSDLDGLPRFLSGVVWLGFAFLAGSGARAGLVVGPNGVEVRARIRSSRFSWPEITDFALRRSIFRPNLMIRLVDGREVPVVGFEPRSQGDARRAEQIVAKLNRRVTIGGQVLRPPTSTEMSLLMHLLGEDFPR
jgi:PH (Pleckstrin Homology) domain-containing protein